MLTITKQNNALIVKGDGNGFYPDNGTNSYPLNSISVVIDESDMATFRSAANNDVLFSGLIQDITIEGEKVTKDNIIEKFDAVANGAQGGGGDVTQAQLDEVKAIAQDADTKADAVTSRIEDVETQMGNKQDTLVSGVNIKTINSQSILGSGDLAISGVSEEQAQEIAKIPNLETEIAQKANVSDIPTVQTDYQGTNKKYIYSEGNIDNNNKTVVSNIVNVNDNPDTVKLDIYEWGGSMGKVIKLPSATTTVAGVMSAADKTKLDSIPENIPTQTEVDNIAANVSTLQTDMMGKQDTLVSGTNIKTINGNSILGEGNLVIEGGDIDLSNYYNKTEVDTKLDTKQNNLVSGTNIKTINGESVLGEGNIEITGGDVDLTNYYTKTETDTKFASKEELAAVGTVANGADAKADAATSRVESVETSLGNKQDTLVSGTNIKTVNSQSILGSGDLTISGVSEEQAQEIAKIPTIETELAQKANVSDVPTVQTGYTGTNKNYIYSDVRSPYAGVISKVSPIPSTDTIDIRLYNWTTDRDAPYSTEILTKATTRNAGVMSAADKTKLDSISTEWTGTQAEYDALAIKDDNTTYYITD